MAHTILSICLAVVLLSILFTRPRKTLRLPPGPRPKPIIGNFPDLPPNGQPEFQHWLKHKDKYGPVTSVTVMGTTIVVIHDLPTARLLLEKKAAVTSGRPYFEFAQSLCGLDEILALRQPDDQWRHRRRFLQKGIGSSDQYSNMMEAETTQLLAQILDKPTDLIRNLHT
jgi:fumagillin biosynthesis cytochrome P450 monooxygenase